MNVLILCDLVGYVGGTESYLSRILPNLQHAGVRLSVFARRILDSSAFGVTINGEIALGKDMDPPNPEAASKIRRIIDELQPDAVMTSNVFDHHVLQAARHAPRLIIRIHDHRMFCPQGDRLFPHFPQVCMQAMGSSCLVNAALRGCAAGLNLKTLRIVQARQQLKEVLSFADRFVVSSHFMEKLCILNGMQANKVVLARPPIGEDIPEYSALRPIHDRIFFAGRLVRDKGLASLIRAIAKIPPSIRPVLAVAGALTQESQGFPTLAQRLGVTLTMLGYLTPYQITHEMDASSIVAMPSLWPEPFGLVGIEAQARGRPIVAYAVGGIPEWIGNAGIAVPRGKEKALASAITHILNKQRWKEYSAAAIQQATYYTPQSHTTRLLKIFTLT